MKCRVKDCISCRQQIHAEEQEAYLKKQYAWINDGMSTMAALSATVALSVQVMRGRSKAYIQKFYDDMVMLYTTGAVMGKPINMKDIMQHLENEYNIDFSRIQINFTETEKEFIKACKEGAKRNGRKKI